MKPLFSFSVRSGLITLGLLGGLSTPSHAGPILKPVLPVQVNAMAPDIVPARESWAGGNDRQMYDWRWRNRHGAREWRGGKDHWRWRGRHEAWRWRDRDDWRWRHRRHHRRHFNDSAIFFGLGLGLPAYHYYNNYDYYDYVPPAPRRYYRTQRLSSAHVRWCYDRYRSYRAWDNTFQPYGGPRRQCWSPYS
ncbi:MAG: BA14K family protein [Mesorhizobium sp.]|uniref:BA14K family protein n=1 Tax=Mesorhizobium sp. TaxID=1871066 RepID=UPI000FEA76A2|nr:BA14K family protein [Mesorhizobium sp.]RWM23349.1 MAG: BA14K family protein [Mesorhizobium sp.]TIP76199.1 MAG: BA14K family protein [Mesorhizobium sp.]TIQ15327.1 MAG: BA14K family protein [Mesorhizobium sp.]TIR54164.1 MAG: BA14K family protein [Mesorhizobium sp.]TJW00424.1 MAG: BA14K family protein [Mesorhizobium sp.]